MKPKSWKRKKPVEGYEMRKSWKTGLKRGTALLAAAATLLLGGASAYAATNSSGADTEPTGGGEYSKTASDGTKVNAEGYMEGGEIPHEQMLQILRRGSLATTNTFTGGTSYGYWIPGTDSWLGNHGYFNGYPAYCVQAGIPYSPTFGSYTPVNGDTAQIVAEATAEHTEATADARAVEQFLVHDHMEQQPSEWAQYRTKAIANPSTNKAAQAAEWYGIAKTKTLKSVSVKIDGDANNIQPNQNHTLTVEMLSMDSKTMGNGIHTWHLTASGNVNLSKIQGTGGKETVTFALKDSKPATISVWADRPQAYFANTAKQTLFYVGKMTRIQGKTSVRAITPTEITPDLNKRLVGNTGDKRTLSFRLSAVNEPAKTTLAKPQDVSVKTDENTGATAYVKFNKLKFTEPGTYEYAIAETTPKTTGWQDDSETHPYTVVVTKDKDNILHATGKYDGVSSALIVSDYKPSVTTNMVDTSNGRNSEGVAEFLKTGVYNPVAESWDNPAKTVSEGAAASVKTGTSATGSKSVLVSMLAAANPGDATNSSTGQSAADDAKAMRRGKADDADAVSSKKTQDIDPGLRQVLDPAVLKDGKFSFTDEIKAENLKPGEYKAYGTLHYAAGSKNHAAGEAVLDKQGQPVSAVSETYEATKYKTVTPMKVTYGFAPPADYEGSKFVSYIDIKSADATAKTADKTVDKADADSTAKTDANTGAKDSTAKADADAKDTPADDDVIVSDADPSNTHESLYAAKIRTKVSEKTISPQPNQAITDEIIYENLIPGAQYTVKGVEVDKTSGKTVATAETVFTPDKSDGTTQVTFSNIDASSLPKHTFVAKEYLYHKENQVGHHDDTGDEQETTLVDAKPAQLAVTGSDVAWLAVAAVAVACLGGFGVWLARRKKKPTAAAAASDSSEDSDAEPKADADMKVEA